MTVMGWSSNDVKESMGMDIQRHPIDQFFYELCPQLPLMYRLGGYACCVFVGFVLSLGSWLRLADLLKGHPGPFVLLFTIGNIITVLGSLLLNGPYEMGKRMVGPQMRCATVSFLIAMICTFVVAYTPSIKDGGERLGLIIMLIIIQYICLIWFIICSVWFIKQAVLGCMKGACERSCPRSVNKSCGRLCEVVEDAQNATVAATNNASQKAMTVIAPPPKKEESMFSIFGTSK